MTLHEHTGVDRHVQLAAQVGHSLRLMLAAAIGKEDEGNALRLEVGESLMGARQWIRAPKQHSVDTDSRQWWYRTRSRGGLLERESKLGNGGGWPCLQTTLRQQEATAISRQPCHRPCKNSRGHLVQRCWEEDTPCSRRLQ